MKNVVMEEGDEQVGVLYLGSQSWYINRRTTAFGLCAWHKAYLLIAGDIGPPLSRAFTQLVDGSSRARSCIIHWSKRFLLMTSCQAGYYHDRFNGLSSRAYVGQG